MGIMESFEGMVEVLETSKKQTAIAVSNLITRVSMYECKTAFSGLSFMELFPLPTPQSQCGATVFQELPRRALDKTVMHTLLT